MGFDCLFDGADLAGNLFVQFASNNMFEHFALTRCERGQVRPDFGKFGLLLPKRAVFLNGRTNGRKKVCIVDGLGKEITCAVFHRLNALGNVTVTGQENDRQETACFREGPLELKTVNARHGDVEHETTQRLRIVLR
jgi:hypothetical protein